MAVDPETLETREGDFSAPEIDGLEKERIEGSFSTDSESHSNRLEEGITDSEIVGVFDTSDGALWSEVENSRYHGDIDATNLLKHGRNSVATGGNITAEGALQSAEESLVLGDKVQVTRGDIGNRFSEVNTETEGNVIAARDLTLGPTKTDKLEWSLEEFRPENMIRGHDLGEKAVSPLVQTAGATFKSLGYTLGVDYRWSNGDRMLGFERPEAEGMPVITEGAHPDEDVTEFYGEWNELSEYLVDRVPEGDFRGFSIFKLPGRIESVEELEDVVRDVENKYPEVKEDFGTLNQHIENFDLPPLEGTNQEIYDRLKNFVDLSEHTGNVNILGIDDPETEGIVYGITSGYNNKSTLDAPTFTIEESVDEFEEAIKKAPLNSTETEVTFEFLDFPGMESSEELLYELKAREMIGAEMGEVYKFANVFSEDLDLDLPWEKDRGLRSKIKSFLGEEADQRQVYSKLREIDEKFDFEAVREGKDLLRSMTNRSQNGEDTSLDYSLSGSTEERYQQLLNMEEEFMDHIEEEWDLGGEAMEIIEEGNTSYLMRNIREASDYEGGIEEFLADFSGGKPDNVLEPGFTSTKFTDGDKAIDTREEATEAAYSEGVELLSRLSNKQGSFSVNHPEIEELEEELEQTVEEISSSDGRPPEELIQKKNQLKSEIPEKRRKVVFSDLGLDYSEDTDYSEMEPEELRQVLDQLGQEYLEGDDSNPETDAGKAREIAGRIDLSGDVGNGYVEFEVYDKDILDLPSDDRNAPCSFPGGPRDGEFIGYMRDPGTQIALLESGDDEGAVISHQVQQDDEDYLLVHSVESDDSITSRNDISLAIREQIEEYAEAAEMNGVIYSTSSHNTAANDFIDAALKEDPDYQEQTYTVDKKGSEDIYLDFELPDVRGYKVEL